MLDIMLYLIKQRIIFMKKLVIAVSIAVASLSSAFADDGKINFTGVITDDACTPVNDVSNPLEVPMGTVSSKAFSTTQTANPHKFSILLKDCPLAATSAKVTFDGTADSNVPSVLALTQVAGVATNVGIQITDKQNVVVPLYTESSAYPLTVGDNSLDFVARYYKTGTTVTAGPADATTNFTIVYN
jgi:major type 1 subunit fimbrin (pilin)